MGDIWEGRVELLAAMAADERGARWSLSPNDRAAIAHALRIIKAAEALAAEVRADLADDDAPPLHAQLRSRVALEDMSRAIALLDVG